MTSSYQDDERTVLAQALVAHRDAVDFDDVEAHWDEYGSTTRTQAMYDAAEFIALYDTLTAIREGEKQYQERNAATQDVPGHHRLQVLAGQIEGMLFVDILAKHQPRVLNVGIMLDNKAVQAMPCAGCDFIAHVAPSTNAQTTRLRHQFAAHQAKMIREGN